MIGCEDRLRNDLYCVGWGVKLYSNQIKPIYLVSSGTLSLRAGVTESGGDKAQKAQLVKELRAATQKAKSELGNSRPTSAAKQRQTASNSQRWTSTDDDYLPDRPQARPDLQSRSRTRAADLGGSGSRPRTDPDSMDSNADRYSSSRQRRLSGSEDGYGRTHSSRDSRDDDDDDDVRNGLRRAKTDLARSFHTGSPRE